MSLFPFIDGSTDEIAGAAGQLPLCREIAWDYEREETVIVDGEFKKAEGAEAVKIWCYTALRTKRFRHIIFSWNYGNEIEILIGRSNYAELIKSQVQRYVKETLLVNPYIISVPEISLNSLDGRLKIHVKINTVYGETEVNAIV